MKYEIKYSKRNTSSDDIVADIKRVSSELQKTTVTQDDYIKHGKYGYKSIYRKIGSWPKALELAGLPISNIGRKITNEELFENLEKVWIKLGRQQNYSELCKPLSDFHVATYQRRFGGWIKSLKSFSEFINNKDAEKQTIPENPESYISSKKKHTVRNVNLRLRFKTMMRDSFKCCKCGKSPSIDIGVKLEVDHIIPWSKGGETELENLQTLCFECNQGKSDMI